MLPSSILIILVTVSICQFAEVDGTPTRTHDMDTTNYVVLAIRNETLISMLDCALVSSGPMNRIFYSLFRRCCALDLELDIFNVCKMAMLFVGKYVYKHSENVDEYLRSLGCGLVIRSVLGAIHPTLQIEYDPVSEKWKIMMDFVLRQHELGFMLGEFVECDETFDFRKCRTVVKLDEGNGATLVMTQIAEAGPLVTTRIEKLPTGSIKFGMESGGRNSSLVFRPFTSPQTEGVVDMNAVD